MRREAHSQSQRRALTLSHGAIFMTWHVLVDLLQNLTSTSSCLQIVCCRSRSLEGTPY